jgi:hypothetical protein
MVYTLRFFSLKFNLFHNSNLFRSCIIHILYIECAKINKIIPAPKGYCGLLAVGLRTAQTALICEIYFSPCMEFQVTVSSPS